MSNHHFTDRQIEQLQRNPYVKNVREKAITYKDEFKELFISEYTGGKLPSQIFKDAGFDVQVIGSDRIRSFSSRVKKQFDRIEGFEDQRKHKSGRPRVNGLTPEEQIERLKARNEILQQENDFLKRVRFINRKSISKRAQTYRSKGNTCSSKER